MKIESILIPVDGSLLAEQAARQGVDLASRVGARIFLLRAALEQSFPGADPRKAQEAALQEAQEYVIALAQRLAPGDCSRIEPFVWYGDPATCIVEAARARGVDLIVMSSHRRSGVRRLFLGSVAEAVLRGTTIPILLFPAADADDPVPA